MRAYTISDGHGLQAAILPEKGATVISLRKNGEEFLYIDRDNLNSEERPRCGIPFVFPSFGRLENGQYAYNGKPYPMDIHGFGHTSCWRVVAFGENELRLCLSASDDSRKIYPFDFSTELTFRAKDGRLSILQTYRNLGQTPMPLNFGFHPYFLTGQKERAEVRLSADICLDTVSGDRTDGPTVIRDQVREDAQELCFLLAGVRSPMVFSAEPNGRRISIEFDENFPQAVVWKRRDKPFLCAEPISGGPNGLNTGEHLILAPGEIRQAAVHFICDQQKGKSLW